MSGVATSISSVFAPRRRKGPRSTTGWSRSAAGRRLPLTLTRKVSLTCPSSNSAPWDDVQSAGRVTVVRYRPMPAESASSGICDQGLSVSRVTPRRTCSVRVASEPGYQSSTSSSQRAGVIGAGTAGVLVVAVRPRGRRVVQVPAVRARRVSPRSVNSTASASVASACALVPCRSPNSPGRPRATIVVCPGWSVTRRVMSAPSSV